MRKPQRPDTRTAAPRLPARLVRRLALPRSIAAREGIRLFLVGGAVRDRLLGLPVRDIDLAVEGDAVAFAQRVGEALGVPARAHGRFGTATIECGPEERLDFAATRREIYERPGALPRVTFATIEEDLSRRDFSINAMAVEIAPRRSARLWDPFGGRRDLARRRLRILHPGSFEDDPTRAYRAARYANRLHFSIDPSTRRAVLEAVARGSFDMISGDRRRREIRLLFSEPNRAGAVRCLERLGLISTLHPALGAGPAILAHLRVAEGLASRHGGVTSYILYLLVWSAGLQSKQAEALAQRLAMVGEEQRILRRWPATLGRLSRLPRGFRPSALPALGLSVEEAVAATACLPRSEVRDRLCESLSSAPLALGIRGRDLVRAGIPPGPAIGRALEKTLLARRDGRIAQDLELHFALEAARREVP